MAIVGSFPFNSFLSGVLSCVGTAVLAVCLRIQVNKDNKEFKVNFLLCIISYNPLAFAAEKLKLKLGKMRSNSNMV
ncbi:hypothetical protein CISIN_1g035024mg [Citrus sinensis]|uniref:Dolichyl-diphosphooligosaccharide--protein glycosyltransferase subunit DAD1 n=1 Tax=Citrus sinensis TaxID=2711 RepID=A0A067E5I8_CITSI|nr:hypothetical protein CISIN_1g035024mg [Citrus sinensis]